MADAATEPSAQTVKFASIISARRVRKIGRRPFAPNIMQMAVVLGKTAQDTIAYKMK